MVPVCDRVMIRREGGGLSLSAGSHSTSCLPYHSGSPQCMIEGPLPSQQPLQELAYSYLWWGSAHLHITLLQLLLALSVLQTLLHLQIISWLRLLICTI